MLREKSGTTRGTRWLATALPCGLLAVVGVPSAQAGNYGDVVASQTPLVHWELNETTRPDPLANTPLSAVTDNMSALTGGTHTNGAQYGTDIVLGAASMTPGTGFDGFGAGNTAFGFDATGGLPGGVIFPLIQPEADTPHGMDAGSISMWFNTTNPNAADPFVSGVLWRGDEGSGNLINLRVIDVGGNGVVTLNLEEGEFITVSNGTTGATDYSDGGWHHVAATWEYDIGTDAGMLNLYVDGGTLAGGEQVSTAFNSTSYAPILQDILDPNDGVTVIGQDVMDFDFRSRIGKGRNNARRYNGDIDEAAIWNRTLSAAEVADQFDAAFDAGSGLIGDLDGDGFVGINDLNIVLGVWNQNVPPADPRADPSGDGFVGIDDLNEVLGNWNAGTPPSAAAVPEPATLTLLSIGGFAALRRRR